MKENSERQNSSLATTLTLDRSKTASMIDFFAVTMSRLRISSKNQHLQNARLQVHRYLLQETPSRKHRPSIYDQGSCFLWMIFDVASIGELLPDVELTKFKKICEDLLSKDSACVEAHFGLARMLAYEGQFDYVLHHVGTIREYTNDSLYDLWFAVFTVLSSNVKRSLQFAAKLLLALINSRYAIEAYWGLMLIALKGTLGSELAAPQFYASALLKLDKYYGFLAWYEILSQESFDVEQMLQELLQTKPQRLEGYLKLWKLLNSRHEYERALEVMEKAYLLNSQDFRPMVILSYATALFKAGKRTSCFELLQLEYMKNPSQFNYLFHFGKFCLKSKTSAFTGSAIGALIECSRSCHSLRSGEIQYWLAKAYTQTGELLQAYEHYKQAVPLLSKKFEVCQRLPNSEKSVVKMLLEAKETLKKYHSDILNIDILTRDLNTKFAPEKLKEYSVYIKLIKKFDSMEAKLFEADLLFLSNQHERAIEFLYELSYVSSPSLKAFLKLVNYYQNNNDFQKIKQLYSAMIEQCKKPLVPVQVWVNVQMVYAKTLTALRYYGKALLVYKTIAQVLPRLPIPDIAYTTELQEACTLEDLKQVLDKAHSQNYNAKTKRISEQRADLMRNRRNLSSMVCNEEDKVEVEEKPKNITLFSEMVQKGKFNKKYLELTIETEDSSNIGSRTPKPLPSALRSITPTGQAANTGFSVTTNYTFLYKIGKLCAEREIELEEGLEALHDYLNIHAYWMQEGIAVDEIQKTKAEFWQGVIYIKLDRTEEAAELFAEISSMVFQLGLTTMSEHISSYLKETHKS